MLKTGLILRWRMCWEGHNDIFKQILYEAIVEIYQQLPFSC